MTQHEFNTFCESIEADYKVRAEAEVVIAFENANGKRFQMTEADLRRFLQRWLERSAEIRQTIDEDQDRGEISDPWQYHQDIYRRVFKKFFNDDLFTVIATLAENQTKPLLAAINKYIGFHLGTTACSSDHPYLLDPVSVRTVLSHKLVT